MPGEWGSWGGEYTEHLLSIRTPDRSIPIRCLGLRFTSSVFRRVGYSLQIRYMNKKALVQSHCSPRSPLVSLMPDGDSSSIGFFSMEPIA